MYDTYLIYLGAVISAYFMLFSLVLLRQVNKQNQQIETLLDERENSNSVSQESIETSIKRSTRKAVKENCDSYIDYAVSSELEFHLETKDYTNRLNTLIEKKVGYAILSLENDLQESIEESVERAIEITLEESIEENLKSVLTNAVIRIEG